MSRLIADASDWPIQIVIVYLVTFFPIAPSLFVLDKMAAALYLHFTAG